MIFIKKLGDKDSEMTFEKDLFNISEDWFFIELKKLRTCVGWNYPLNFMLNSENKNKNMWGWNSL